MTSFYVSSKLQTWFSLACLILTASFQVGVAVEAERDFSLHVSNRGHFVRDRHKHKGDAHRQHHNNDATPKNEEAERDALLKRASVILNKLRETRSEDEGADESRPRRLQHHRSHKQHAGEHASHVQHSVPRQPRQHQHAAASFVQQEQEAEHMRQASDEASEYSVDDSKDPDAPGNEDPAASAPSSSYEAILGNVAASFEGKPAPGEALAMAEEVPTAAHHKAPQAVTRERLAAQQAAEPSRHGHRQKPLLSTDAVDLMPQAPPEVQALAEPAATDMVEMLRDQYAAMENTLQRAQSEETTIHGAYVSKIIEDASFAFTGLTTAGLVVFPLLAALAMLLQTTRESSEHTEEGSWLSWARLPKHVPIQMLCLAWTLLCTMQCVMIYPDAFGLPQQQNSMSSSLPLGLLLSLILVCALGARRLMKPWSQTQNRTVVLGLLGGHLAVALLFGAGSDPSDPWRLGYGLRSFALETSRLALAMCASFGGIFIMMTLKVTPSEGLVQFSLFRAAAMCLGGSVGALLASDSIVWVYVPWMVLGVAAMVWIPEDVGPLLAKLAASEDARDALRGALKADRPGHADEGAVLAARQTLGSLALGATLMRGVLTASFQVVATRIFIEDFAFTAPNVLLAAGAAAACGAFVVPLVAIAIHPGGVDVGRICTWAAFCTALAPMLLFRHLSNLWSKETFGLWLAFAANVLVAPAVNVMSGILRGCALREAVPDSGISRENLVTADLILQDGLVRILGPPAVMYLYTVGGRSLCAVALLICAGLVCAGTFIARAALATISGETSPSLKASKSSAAAAFEEPVKESEGAA